jgi:hypothetical protein
MIYLFILSSVITDVTDLTFKDVAHNGFEAQGEADNMCFGCWSSGTAKKCSLHDEGVKKKDSQTMLLCRNWEIGVMRRRYRSEEIQEIFLSKDSSLRFDVKHKKFSTVMEQRHPIYRMLNECLNKFNNRMMLFEKIKRWLLSLNHSIPENKFKVRLMAVKRQLVHHSKLERFKVINGDKMPKAPITGFSWNERLGG